LDTKISSANIRIEKYYTIERVKSDVLAQKIKNTNMQNFLTNKINYPNYLEEMASENRNNII
jgi:hypothetical protein